VVSPQRDVEGFLRATPPDMLNVMESDLKAVLIAIRGGIMAVSRELPHYNEPIRRALNVSEEVNREKSPSTAMRGSSITRKQSPTDNIERVKAWGAV